MPEPTALRSTTPSPAVSSTNAPTRSPEQDAQALLNDLRTLLGRGVSGGGIEQATWQGMLGRAGNLDGASVRPETRARIGTALRELQETMRAASHDEAVGTVDWMTTRGMRQPTGPSARRRRVDAAARQALTSFTLAVQQGPVAAQRSTSGAGGDAMTRTIVANLDTVALGANFTRRQLVQTAVAAGARPLLAERLADDVEARSSQALASAMIDVAQGRLRALGEGLRHAARHPEAMMHDLLASPMRSLRLLSELGVDSDLLQHLGADINRLQDPSARLSTAQRESLQRSVMAQAMGLMDDASRAAVHAAEGLEELRHEEPGRIFSTFPGALDEATRQLPIDRRTAAQIAHGRGTGSLLAGAVRREGEAIESRDRLVNTGIKVGIFLGTLAASTLGSPAVGTVFAVVANAANGAREVHHLRHLAHLTQGAAAAGLNSHQAGREARHRADAAVLQASAEVATAALGGVTGGGHGAGLGHLTQEGMTEAGVSAGVGALGEEHERAAAARDAAAGANAP